MTTHHDADFQQLHGAFDSPIDPDPTFALRLERRLAAEAPRTIDPSTAVSAPVPAQRRPVPPLPRRSNPFMLAAAVLAVFLVSAASIVVLSGHLFDGGTDPDSRVVLPAGLTSTPGPNTTITPQMLRAAPGATDWVDISDIRGDSMLVSSSITTGDGSATVSLTGVSLSTGAEQWNVEAVDGIYQFADDATLIGQISTWTDDPSTPAADADGPQIVTNEVVSIDIASGDTLWSATLPDQNAAGDPLWWNTPLVTGDRVIMTTSDRVVGYDLLTGDLLWTFDLSQEGVQVSANGNPPAVVIWDDDVVVVSTAGDVAVLDPDSGDVVSTSKLDIPYAEQTDDSVYATGLRDSVVINSSDVRSDSPQRLITAIDPRSGDVLWQKQIEPGAILVPHSDTSRQTLILFSMYWEEPNLLLRLFGRTGTTSFQVEWLDGAAGDTILSTERTDNGGAYTATNTDTYACYTADGIVCFDRTGTSHEIPVEQPVNNLMIVGNQLIFVTSDGAIWTANLP